MLCKQNERTRKFPDIRNGKCCSGINQFKSSGIGSPNLQQSQQTRVAIVNPVICRYNYLCSDCNLVNLLAVLGDKNGLWHKDSSKENESSHAQTEHLDVENQKTAPRRLAKGGPGIGNSGIPLTTDDLGLNLALEGAVKGNDGALFNGQE